MWPAKADIVLAVVATVLAIVLAAAQPASAQRQGRGQFQGGIYKLRIAPHWFQEDTRLWYRNDLRGGAKEFVLVDTQAGTRQPTFDHQRLAAALSKATGGSHTPDHLPFDEIEFVEGAKAVCFTADDATSTRPSATAGGTST